MKSIFKTNMMAIAVLASSCGNPSESEKIIGKQEVIVENGRMTPEVLWAFGRLGGVKVSPDGQKILYRVSYFDIEENKSNAELFVMDVNGENKRQITKTARNESSAQWMKNSREIAFLSPESGSSQLWIMDADGSGRKQISDIEGGINDFSFSPDETKVLYIADVKYGERTVDKYPDLPKASGIVVNDLMYKHWDEWKESVPHPFVAEVVDGKIAKGKDLLEGEPYESPIKPFGGIEQLAWSPDGKTIAYTCRKKTGKEYALSTNSDIYFYNLETGESVNKTEGIQFYIHNRKYGVFYDFFPVFDSFGIEKKSGYDINPTFSPDGKYLAWESMERDGYESDKSRLFVMNLQTGVMRDLTVGFDQDVHSLSWAADSESIYFVSCWHATTQIYKAAIDSTKLTQIFTEENYKAKITQITHGVHDYTSVTPANDVLIATKRSMSKPDEIYAVNELNGEETELSFENKAILDQVEMGNVEERWIKTTDNKDMLVWVVYPPHFDPAKKYPALLYCQGGPQSTVSQFWSYRWNLQLMAANDYIIVAPNRRGLPGFGQEWLEQISGDYGGQNMKDYLSAIDAVSKESFVDSDRLGCVGASYGGFSVFWLAGHHNKRFKAFIAHDGMFNLPQQYLETEEMWFVNWDLGGPYWDKSNAVAQRSYANSPHLFVDKWDTPILVIHGEKDYRILASQGMAAFNAAVLRGVPAELLIFPDENHWVLKPQNGILWQRTFFNWLDRWLK